MRYGISLRIDVTKIDKARLFKGERGTYLDVTAWIDPDEQDQYGNNGMLTQAVSKEEREQGVQGAILGNAKVFYKPSQPVGHQAPQPAAANAGPDYGGGDPYSDDIPFIQHMKNTVI